MIDEANVVWLEPRRQKKPTLQRVELRLHNEDCSLEMTLYDEAGNIAAIVCFNLASKPFDFDLDLLREAWARWRHESAFAS